jgi:diguanylate cyclase (GGDEF)-like protein/PAS domain S-box-containing protein
LNAAAQCMRIGSMHLIDRLTARKPETVRILFAEDSKAVAKHVIAFLEQEGHSVTHVENGLAAVQAFAAEFPDLVLADIVMPVMDGIEATRQIKALAGRRWIPVMLMTSLAAHDEVVAGLRAGADEYLTKPIIPEILKARIQSMERIATMQDSLLGILDNVYEGVLTIDKQGRIQSYNRAAESIFGYTAKEVMGQNVSMLMPAPYAAEHDGYLSRYQKEGTPRVIGIGRKVRGLRKNGETFPMRLAVTEVRRGHDRIFIGLVSDISTEEAARERIEFLALHDALTSLPNRAQFNARLEALCANPGEGMHAVLFLDLDGFKPINDTLGHDAGDEALKIAAHRLRRSLAAEDFVARLGGDEFVAICHNIASADAAVAIGNRLLAAIAHPMNLLGSNCKMGASAGIALLPQHGSSASDVLTAADHAMYSAKRQGKNRCALAQAAEKSVER